MGAAQQTLLSFGGHPPGNRYFIEGSNQLWSNAANWWLDSGGTLPAGSVPSSSDDCAIVSGTCTVNGSYATLEVSALATLVISNGNVTVNSGAVLQLNFSGTNSVTKLVLNGVIQPGGVFNSANIKIWGWVYFSAR